MGGACTMHGKEEKCMPGFGVKIWRKEKLIEDQRVDGRVILKFINKK